MNTSALPPDDELRCAEYALGVLDADELREFERAMRHDPRIAQAVADWQERLIPLSEDIHDVPPPPHVWTHIQRELGLAAQGGLRSRGRLWDSVRLWRWIGVTSTAVAAALAAVSLILVQPGGVSTPSGRGYMVASLARQGPGGGAAWTATVDVQHASMVIVPTASVPVAPGHSTELWVIPAGMKPVSLGLIAVDRATVVKLPRDHLAELARQATLAVSVEPYGGSPTGQPTGPVLAAGPVGPA
ncbi:anti-sigma factor [Paraburkholderia sp. CNPSo 3272]|uniref:anti-sigma factor n=1 Tax=Paraburkholderia sp. CNPSo 3272 TaxID=2940931 RepID=UPI0020B75F71|nr:anti-sigma factor [Paraburkholderia sp. CNPSo 3272]MCP3722408.1 anti-sigma factor [Paraburkholderia sp. CNPSo 3272]